jgi:hypothetical protein
VTELRGKLEAIWKDKGCLCPANPVRWSIRRMGWRCREGLYFEKGLRHPQRKPRKRKPT